jgi:hypothetical protein
LDIVRGSEQVCSRVRPIVIKPTALVGEIVPNVEGYMVDLAWAILKQVKVHTFVIVILKD